MSSILDIDLDYFAILDNPSKRLEQLLKWSNCEITCIIDEHNLVIPYWGNAINEGYVSEPEFIIHVDEHHDMMDEQNIPNIGNFMYHVMMKWKSCKVHWMVDEAIDSPEMWISDEAWMSITKRFSCSREIPSLGLKPDLVTVCTSPEFVSKELLDNLLGVIEDYSHSFIKQ